MDTSKKKRSRRSARAKQRLHNALEEINLVPVNEKQDEISQIGVLGECGVNAGKEDHLLIIHEKLFLELLPSAKKLDESVLTFIRRAIEQRVVFVEMGMDHRSSFMLETSDGAIQKAQFI